MKGDAHLQCRSCKMLHTLWLVGSLLHMVVVKANPGDNQLAVMREQHARLSDHLQNISVAKVPPLKWTAEGQLKVTVTVEVLVYSVQGISDAQQTITTDAAIMIIWTDPELSWNSSEYGNVTHIELPVDSVWTPDVYIPNAAYRGSLVEKAPLVTISSYGIVYAWFGTVVETSCQLDLTRYPFDTQSCNLIFYTYSTFVQINLKDYPNLPKNLAVALATASEWVIESDTFGVITLDVASYPTFIPTYTLEVRRKTTFYTVCLVLPMVLTSFMNTLVFLVPLESGEKLSFLVTIFVSTSVFISFFKDVMPRGLDSTPATTKLLIGVMVESLVIILATIFVMAWDRRQSTKNEITDVEPQLPELNAEQYPPKTNYSSKPGEPVDKTVSFKNVSFIGKVTQRDTALEHPDGMVAVKSGDTLGRRASGRVMKWHQRLTALQLDRAFFLLAFGVNVVFLGFLLFL